MTRGGREGLSADAGRSRRRRAPPQDRRAASSTICSSGRASRATLEVDSGGLTLLLDRASARRADGVNIDFVDGAERGGFKIENPNEPPKVKQLSAAELKAMLDRGAVQSLRRPPRRTSEPSPASRRRASLDEAGQAYLLSLDRGTRRRLPSATTACAARAPREHFLGEGFRNVYNLRGGIDAWSQTRRPVACPRY